MVQGWLRSPVIQARRLLFVMPVTARPKVARVPARACARGVPNLMAGALLPSFVRVGCAIRSTCYLTPVTPVVWSLLCCPVCRGDMRRPPLHDLQVQAKRPGEQGGGRVAFIMSWRPDDDGGGPDGTGRLAGFRRELYLSLGTRRDVLFEACDAALCKPGRVLMLAELCLEPECRRVHGAVYDALNCGDVWFARLRRALS